jgi:hypothetical protein
MRQARLVGRAVPCPPSECSGGLWPPQIKIARRFFCRNLAAALDRRYRGIGVGRRAEDCPPCLFALRH